MLASILRLSLRQRLFVFILSAITAGIGIWSALQIPIDAVPDITNKQVVINATYAGLGPRDVEERITFPLELALSEIPHLENTRSVSQFGLSQITAVFQDDVDIYQSRQLVNERLQEVKDQLPSGTSVEMGPITTGLGEIYDVRIVGGHASLIQRRTMMDWIVAPQLRTIPGLAEVNVWGGYLKQYQVRLDPSRLLEYGITLQDVWSAVANNNQDAGAAYILRGPREELVGTVGTLQNLSDIEQIVVGAHAGQPVTVDQVADVRIGSAVREGAITQDGQGEQVYAICQLLTGNNALQVVASIKKKMAQIQPALPPGMRLVGAMDRSRLIDRTIHTALWNLIHGGALVVLVLFFFLLQVRAGLIVSSVIPLSMLMAVIGMLYLHVSANLMSLGAIDFGLIVDGAVIIVENCIRELGARRREVGRELTEEERLTAIEAASLSLLKPSLFGVIIIMAAYLPILSLGSIEGKMFRPMALTVILALLSSLLLSLTLVPALCAGFLKASEERAHPVLDWLEERYCALLERAARARWLMLGCAVLFVVVCGFLFGRLGSTFLPDLDEGALSAEIHYPPGNSLEQTVRQSTVLERELLREFPTEIESIISRIGHPEHAMDPELLSTADTLIPLWPRSHWRGIQSQEELVRQMAAVVAQSPGVTAGFSMPIKGRESELLEGSGVRSDLGIKIFGPDQNTLAQLGARITQICSSVPGAADVRAETTQGQPVLRIRIRRDQIARYGISVRDLNNVVETAVGGSPATVLNTGAERFDVVVRLKKEYRDTPEAIGRILVASPVGPAVPLSELTGIQEMSGPVKIYRQNGQRFEVVMVNARGRDLGGLVEDIQRRISSQVHLPMGYHVEYGGTYRRLVEGRNRLGLVAPATFILIFVLLFAAFRSLKQAAMVFTGIPLAVCGGILALLIRQMPFSMPAGIGFIALFGVAMLNGLVLVVHINELRDAGLPVRKAVRDGCARRLRPVLMTASVASLGFVPMAISQGAGAAVQKPLATVVIGGIVTSTLLTLLVLPTLYGWLERD